MFEILNESTETCIGFRVTGKVAKADYDILRPKLDEAYFDLSQLADAWEWACQGA